MSLNHLIRKNRYFLISGIAVCLALILPAVAQKPANIELVTAGRMQFDKSLGDDVRRLIGSVHFRHEDTDMFCDSAYLYATSNSIRAFGHVFIQVSDTVSIYGDVLYYNGNTRLAELTGKVRMQDPQMTLTTSLLYYDLQANTARYANGGKIVDAENVLTSVHGFYYADLKDFFFRDDVVLVNPEYTMHADTLQYNTLSETAYFFGPTTIVSEENTIFCRNGWYDTRNDIARFSRDAYFTNNEQSLTGDTLFYDRSRGYGRADMNVVMRDSVQNTIITGHFAEHFEQEGKSIVTIDALLIMIEQNDSLFLHADTLMSVVDDENELRWLFAYHKARFYRRDLQGLSDSIVYNFSDSTIFMYHNPVLWSDVHQLTAKMIEINTGEEEIKSVHLHDIAFIASEEDSLGYNQVKGKSMTGHFRENELWRIDVFDNGETIYHVREEDGTLVGINKALSANIVIFVEEKKVTGIRFLSRPEASLFPPGEMPEEDKELRNFQWLDHRRPKSRDDVFVWQ